MSTKRITAIVPLELLQSMERHLRECGIPGVTVEHVQGYGRHPNFFSRDLMKENARMILYVADTKVDTVVAAIMRCASECGAQAGIVAVESVDKLVNLASGADEASSGDQARST